jgi:hypothetical protein
MPETIRKHWQNCLLFGCLPVLLIRIQNPYEMERKKNQSQDQGSVNNIPYPIFENFLTFFGLNILEFYRYGSGSGISTTMDPGSGLENNWIRDPG